MDESRKRQWDVRLGIVGPMLTLLAIIIGVGQFNVGENHRRQEQDQAAVEQSRLEFKRRLWMQRQETYRALAELTGKVIAYQGTPGAKSDEAYRSFVSAYWGAMILVEDPKVERAMISFHLELLDVRNGWSKGDLRLKTRADDLLKACRTDLERELRELPGSGSSATDPGRPSSSATSP